MKLYPVTSTVQMILDHYKALAFAACPGDEHAAIIMVDRGQEYVTWVLDLKAPATYWGHYYRYDDFGGQDGARRAAMNDFCKRAKLETIDGAI